MKKGWGIGYILVLVLTAWGCGSMVQIWKKESVWTPRISFYVPGFMFKSDSKHAEPAVHSTTLPLPDPQAESLSSTDYVFSNTPLPIIEADGPIETETHAARKYQKPVSPDPHKKQVAILISPIGFDDKTTATVLSTLPEQVTLSFSADAPYLQNQLESARRHGFETMLFIPTETSDFPAYDAGPHAIYSFQDDATHQAVLHRLLTGPLPISGIVTQNSAVMEKMPDFDALIKEHVSDKGLIYISTEPVAVPFNKAADFDFKENFYPQALDTYRDHIEQKARAQGSAIAIFPPVPLVLQTIARWISQNSAQDIEFVPVSTLLSEELS